MNMEEKTLFSQKNYRKDLHYFRAISILIIVLGHSVAGWPNIGLYGYIGVFIRGSTGLFVFISGYFFQYFLNSNFNYINYLRKKKNNILVPYFVLTTFSYIYILLSGRIYLERDVPLSYIKMLLYGKAYSSYWYIPFATLLFLSAPFFVWIQKKKYQIKLSMLLALLILAIIIQRPKQADNAIVILHNYFYFIPYYLMGILYFQYQESIEKRLYNVLSFVFFSSISILSTITIVNYWKHHEQVNNLIFINDGLVTFISKISLIISLLIFTKWIMHKEHYLLDIIGNTSFTIYFLHLFFMQKLFKYIDPYTGSILLDIISVLLLLINSTVLPILTARLLKNIFDNKSRYLVGY